MPRDRLYELLEKKFSLDKKKLRKLAKNAVYISIKETYPIEEFGRKIWAILIINIGNI